MNKLIRSEWIKLRSLRTTWILAILAILTAMGITGAATGTIEAGSSAFERVDLLLTPAPLLVRLFILVLGIMAFSNEYRYGTIIPSLAAAPIRGELLAAKLVVLGAFGLLLGAVVTIASTACVNRERQATSRHWKSTIPATINSAVHVRKSAAPTLGSRGGPSVVTA